MERPLKVITIPNRDSAGWLHGTNNVVAVWLCPTCSLPMGVPQPQSFCEDGEFFTVDVWKNECGHIAKYAELTLVQPEGIASVN